MKICVLGAGNMGCAVAADLTQKDHEVTLIKTSESIHNENFSYLLSNGGQIRVWEAGNEYECPIAHITNDLSRITDAELVFMAIQTNYHRHLIERMLPYLRDGQIILIVPGYLSTAYVLRYSTHLNLTIVEGESSPIDCRIDRPGHIKIGFRNVRNPVGVYPFSETIRVESVLAELGYHYTYLSSVVEAALHNPNLIVHTVGAVMSIPRIEKMREQYCMYWEVFTPGVWNILERLDEEKMNVLAALGYKRLPYVDACKHRNSLDTIKEAKDVFFEYASSPYRAKGPTSLESRYITEDVSQGLVLLEALAERLAIASPLCTSLIEMACSALGRDLRAEGRTIHALGADYIDKILTDGV